MLVTEIRRVRKLIPELASVWVREHNWKAGDPGRLGRPGGHRPAVSELVDDANELVWAAEDLEADGLELTTATGGGGGVAGLVAGQDVEPGDGPGQWRITRGTAPDWVVSTVDPESRHVHKTQHSYRDGYKAHLAVEPDTA